MSDLLTFLTQEKKENTERPSTAHRSARPLDVFVFHSWLSGGRRGPPEAPCAPRSSVRKRKRQTGRPAPRGAHTGSIILALILPTSRLS